VGRERELKALLETLRHVRAAFHPRLVSITGPPGIGKSRLVAELAQVVEADADLIAWRQGRTPPYGEGSPFGALGRVSEGGRLGEMLPGWDGGI
jgi:predicted ATPase